MAPKQLSPCKIKSRGGREVARSPTRADGVKRQEAQGSAGQGESRDQGANCESAVLLKNLAKLLVDRIEAACAAKEVAQVANPNKALASATTNSPTSSESDSSVPVRGTDHGTSCPSSHENGSSGDEVGDELCEEKANPPAPEITERNRRVRGGDDAHRRVREGRQEFVGASLGEKGEPLRAPARESWTLSPGPRARPNVASLSVNSRVSPEKKAGIHVAQDDSGENSRRDGARPSGGLKIRSPGLRSLVVPQVKEAAPSPPGGNSKLALRSSTPIQKRHKEEISRKEQEVGSLELEALYETVWADVVQDVFDEVFRGEGEPPRRSGNSNPQAQTPPTSSTDQLLSAPPPRILEPWVVQVQSIKSHLGRSERAASRRIPVQKAAKEDKKDLETPKEESASKEVCTSETDGSSSREPVVLPTLAKYHMDKKEQAMRDVGEEHFRGRRFQQECPPPPPVPDPYNVLNVYAERCASQQRSRSRARRS